MKRSFVLASVLIVFATPALATECPTYIQKIDAALAANQNLSADQIEDAKKHRADGEAAHAAGKHDEAVKELQSAAVSLGIQA